MEIRVYLNRYMSPKGTYLFTSKRRHTPKNFLFTLLPRLSAARKNIFLAEYCRILNGYSRENKNNKPYWYTNFSVGNFEKSKFYKGLENCYKLEDLLNCKRGSTLSIYCDDPIFYYAINAFFSLKPNVFVSVGLFDKFFLCIKLAALRMRKFWFFLLCSILLFLSLPVFLVKFLCRWRFRGVYDVIFVTKGLHNERSNSLHGDTYFGGMMGVCASESIKPLPFYYSVIKKVPGVFKFSAGLSLIYTIDAIFKTSMQYFDYLKLHQFVSGCLRTLRFTINDPPCYEEGSNIGLVILGEICFFGVLKHALLYSALDSALAANKNASLVYRYSGSAWENSCVFAAQKHNRASIGYQNAGMNPAKLRMNYHYQKYRAKADSILTTGAEAKRILVECFGHNPDKVLAGCAFRQQGVYKYKVKSRSKLKASVILILLQGKAIDRLLVSRVVTSLSHTKEKRSIYIRQHPAATVNLTAQLEEYNLCGYNIMVSDIKDVHKDILRSDVIMYYSSTAALEALALGVPAIYIDLGESLSASPLSHDHGLAAEFQGGTELAALADRLVSQPQKILERSTLDSSQYFYDYFHEATDEAIKKMVSDIRFITDKFSDKYL
jgi:hypothetical protein